MLFSDVGASWRERALGEVNCFLSALLKFIDSGLAQPGDFPGRARESWMVCASWGCRCRRRLLGSCLQTKMLGR